LADTVLSLRSDHMHIFYERKRIGPYTKYIPYIFEMCVLLTVYYLGDKFKGEAVGGACVNMGSRELHAEFLWENLK
jgi:hypothetical protein